MSNTLDPSIHFDSDKLKNRVGHNETLYKQFITLIQTALNGEISNSVIELEKCIASDDLTQLQTLAHKIKGIALSSSFGRLASLANSLEHDLTNNKGDIQQLIQDITSEVALLKGLVV